MVHLRREQYPRRRRVSLFRQLLLSDEPGTTGYLGIRAAYRSRLLCRRRRSLLRHGLGTFRPKATLIDRWHQSQSSGVRRFESFDGCTADTALDAFTLPIPFSDLRCRYSHAQTASPPSRFVRGHPYRQRAGFHGDEGGRSKAESKEDEAQGAEDYPRETALNS